MPTGEKATREEVGKRSFEQGQSFETKSAELYRLHKYSVEHGRIFSGRQVDLFLTGRWGDLVVLRAVECKSGDVTVRDIDDFLLKLRLVRREYPAASGTILTGVRFSDAVNAHAATEGITLTTYRDLAASLVDGHRYVSGLQKELASNDRYNLQNFVEPRIALDISGADKPALEILKEWLQDGEARQLTLLGDLGTGKSFLCRKFCQELAAQFLEDPLANPFPVLVDLRETDRELSREGLIVTHFARQGIEGLSFNLFLHALREGNIVLVLDGFDEMASRVSQNVTVRNFSELMRCVEGRAKVLLTCRTHYFRDRTEEEEVLLGTAQNATPESAKDLYWDLIGRNGYRIAYLRPFSISQIREYVRRVRGEQDHKQVLEAIRTTYDLMELSSRPLLLDMIVKTIDRLAERKIDAGTLYQVFTDTWVTRDSWRNVLSKEEKQSFVSALAIRYWQTAQIHFHYTELVEYVKSEFAAKFRDYRVIHEVDHEIRTASFLTRDTHGNYGFAHKSYAEFFLAQHLATELKNGNVDCLAGGKLTPEVASFIRDLLKDHNAASPLEAILVNDYRPIVSENALLMLYCLRLYEAKAKGSERSKLKVELPRGMKLGRAQLSQMNFEQSNMQNADFRGADFSQSVLRGSDLSNSQMELARFDKADLRQAVFHGCTMTNASLASANAIGLDLSHADLASADISYADLSGAIATGAALANVQGTGAMVSTAVGELLGGRTETERLKWKIVADASEKDIWSVIQEELPRIRALSQRMALVDGSDPDDLISEAVIQLASAMRHEGIATPNREELRRVIAATIERILIARRRERDRSVSVVEAGIRNSDYDVVFDDEQIQHLNALLEHLQSDARSAEDPALLYETKHMLAKLRERLSNPHRQMLQALLQGDSIEEIATALSMPPPAIRRGIATIRRAMMDLYGNT